MTNQSQAYDFLHIHTLHLHLTLNYLALCQFYVKQITNGVEKNQSIQSNYTLQGSYRQG